MVPEEKQTSELIDQVFKAHFVNNDLTADDAAVLVPPAGRMAVSTDGFIVSPAFFSGGKYRQTVYLRNGK